MSEELSKDAVLAKAIQGDFDAFSVLYEQNVERIYNYIFYRTGNKFDAEDLTARVFFRALGHIKSYKNMGVPFSAWLYRIAHNLVANWHRDNSRRKEVPLEGQIKIFQGSEHPEMTLVQNQETDMLLGVIGKLPADKQQLLILKFVERLTNAEIAMIMDRSEGAIKSLYHRTLLSLRSNIKKMDS